MWAAGGVFSVVAVEILPDILKNHSPVQVVLGFTLGLLTMLGIKSIAEREAGEALSVSNDRLPISLLVGIGVDVAIDGILLGIGFAAGSTEGMLLAVALSIELLSLGMATATELGNNNMSKAKSLTTILYSYI